MGGPNLAVLNLSFQQPILVRVAEANSGKETPSLQSQATAGHKQTNYGNLETPITSILGEAQRVQTRARINYKCIWVPSEGQPMIRNAL